MFELRPGNVSKGVVLLSEWAGRAGSNILVFEGPRNDGVVAGVGPVGFPENLRVNVEACKNGVINSETSRPADKCN